MGSIQKIQVAALKDFLCSADFESLARRAVQISLCIFCWRECSRRKSAAVDAVYYYDLPCEKANQENPQIFLICKYKNNFSDEFAQSNAEGI